MDRLTDEKFWDQSWQETDGQRSGTKAKVKKIVRKLFGDRLISYSKPYDDYLLWEVIYPKYLANIAGLRAVEIGSAPGTYLVGLKKQFGIVPYGIEYTPAGAETNRNVFAANGIDASNVIHADFFSDDIHRQYKEFFDLVISRGFIEHFDDVASVIDRHLSLLKPGGLLVISVPNYRGVYYPWLWLFRKAVLNMHNVKIMKRKEFAKLFERSELSARFCGYYGTFTFNHYHAAAESPLRFATYLLHAFQWPLNVVLRLMFRTKSIESRVSSPFLLFIGTKAPASDF